MTTQSEQVSGNRSPDVSLKIALIEDNVDCREMLQSLLQLEGYDVEVAADGREGLDLILKTAPRVAFVDIGLPELDGYEVARKIRQSLTSDQVYLVALTGYGRERDRKAILEAGFDKHLVKPFAFEDLIRFLKEFVSRTPQAHP